MSGRLALILALGVLLAVWFVRWVWWELTHDPSMGWLTRRLQRRR